MTGYCEFREGKIRYSVKGKGRTIVFLHGFLEDLSIWDSLTQSLSKTYRIISIDLPGHGGSDNFGYVHAMELMAEAVMAVCKKYRLRKILLCGHSMGGYASLAFAEKFPDHLKGLCLFHSSALADTKDKKADRDRAIEAVKSHPKKFIRGLIGNLFHEKNRAEFRQEIKALEEHAIKTSPQGIVACTLGMKERVNREIVLKFAPYPVLIIAGDNDPVIPLETSVAHSKLPEKAFLKVFENCGHMGFIENQSLSLSALRSFAYKCFRKAGKS